MCIILIPFTSCMTLGLALLSVPQFSWLKKVCVGVIIHLRLCVLPPWLSGI